MNTEIPSSFKASCVRWSCLWLPALVLLLVRTAHGERQDINLLCPPDPPPLSFTATFGTPVDSSIGTLNNPGVNVFWAFNTIPCRSESLSSFTCNGVTVSLPAGAPDQSVSKDATVTINGTPTAVGGPFRFRLAVREDRPGGRSCERDCSLTIVPGTPPSLKITPSGSLLFGKFYVKPPDEDKKEITITNNENAVVGPIDFTINDCTFQPCPFTAPDSISNLDPGASKSKRVDFLSAQTLWDTDYSAKLVVTVRNTTYKAEIPLKGNKGQPVIKPQPDKLNLAPEVEQEVVLVNQESEKLTGIGIEIINCGNPCLFSVTPNTLDLERKGDRGDSKKVRVKLVGITCGSTADLEVTVPHLPRRLTVATISLKGSSEGLKRCSQDFKSVQQCINGVWQTQGCQAGDSCSDGVCRCPLEGARICSPDSKRVQICRSSGQWQDTQNCAETFVDDFCAEGVCRCNSDGQVCAGFRQLSLCRNGSRVAEECPNFRDVCENNVCQMAQCGPNEFRCSNGFCCDNPCVREPGGHGTVCP